MKLKDRKACHIGSVKQEDCKLKPGLNKSSCSIVDVSNTSQTTIKQEDTKDYDSLLKQKDEFGENGYYYCCDICQVNLANLTSVLEHRKSTHNIKPGRSRLIKDINVEPDIHNPNFYCNTCEKSFINQHRFRHHLNVAHFLVLKPLPTHKAPLSNILPDPSDPNLFCRACNYTYKSKYTFKNHCRYVHGMNSVEFRNQKSTSRKMIDSYCQACDKRLSSMQSFHKHLFAIHKVDSRATQQKRNDLLPDVNDPNFYCRSCDKKFVSKYSFKTHLMVVHSIYKSEPYKKTRLKPDADDPNHYCRACQKTYASRNLYRQHLRLAHQMRLTSLKANASGSTDLPDPYNPDHYCSVCRKTYTSSSRYREHCKRSHLMVLDHSSILDPDATININDPDFYCAKCQHSYSCKITFKRHLRKVHFLLMPSNRY